MSSWTTYPSQPFRQTSRCSTTSACIFVALPTTSPTDKLSCLIGLVSLKLLISCNVLPGMTIALLTRRRDSNDASSWQNAACSACKSKPEGHRRRRSERQERIVFEEARGQLRGTR